ncbi:hypothetical protein Tco_1310191 [Tanacetum coccineum]
MFPGRLSPTRLDWKIDTVEDLGLKERIDLRVWKALDEFLRDFGLPAWHIHVGGGVSVGDGFGGLWTANGNGGNARGGALSFGGKLMGKIYSTSKQG